MAVNIEIVLKRLQRIYFPHDTVEGVLVLDAKGETKHEGIYLHAEGVVSVQMPPKSVNVLDSLVTNTKPIVILGHAVDIEKAKKLSLGRTEYPFSFVLQPKQGKQLYETYHGLYINVQYTLRCEVKRSLLAKDLLKTQEFFVAYKASQCEEPIKKAFQFKMSPETLQNVRDRMRIPRFLVKGHLNSLKWDLTEPLTGELTICECERGISSIEAQLLRVETCGTSEVHAKEVSEIQNIQVVYGSAPHELAIPIHMIFPRLFTCVTTVAANFRIEYELNMVIIFDNDLVVEETFPITLTRG